MSRHASTDAPAQQAGLSTIPEREVQNVLRWVTGEPEAVDEKRSTLPILLMMAFSIAGCLTILLPWLEIEIIDTRVTSAEASAHSDGLQTWSGSDRWPGITTSIAFGFFAFLLLTHPGKQRLTLIRAVLMTATAVVALTHTFLFRFDIESGSITIRTSSSHEST